MKWIDGLCALWTREHSGQDPQQVRDTELAYFDGVEPIVLYRAPLKGGKGLGGLTLTGLAYGCTDSSAAQVEAEPEFYTVAQMDLELPGNHRLTLRPKSFTLFGGRWSVDTDLPKETVERIINVVESIEPECARVLDRVFLLPPKDGKHSILVRTKKLPHQLGRFSAVANYRLEDEDGRVMKSSDAAVHLMDNLLTIARQIALILK